MPTADEIHGGLTAIANEAITAAILWHVALASVLVALVLGWRPARGTARILLLLPLVSVGAFALAFRSWFNGAVFCIASLVLLGLAGFRDRGPVTGTSGSTRWAGAALLAFGWIYPHFLAGPPATYLYASPVGLVPCPTLYVVIGLALLAGGLGARPWTLTLAALGIFYGLFGVLRLGVLLDLPLIFGALSLALHAMRPPAPAPQPASPRAIPDPTPPPPPAGGSAPDPR